MTSFCDQTTTFVKPDWTTEENAISFLKFQEFQ